MTMLTGIKPTGQLHLGNYVGALRPTIELARTHPGPVYALVADMHALNAAGRSDQIGRMSLDAAAHLMALDEHEQLTIYRSSRIPQIGQLTQLLAPLCPKGYMNRAHAYKAAVARAQQAGEPADSQVNMGLYLYPLLMAADIVAVGATEVPVGSDQLQHTEIAQELVRVLNRRYGAELAYPQPVSVRGQLLTGLDGRKMSKSYDNTVPLLGAGRATALRRIATDSRPMSEPADPDACNLMAIYRTLATADEIAELEATYRAGGFGYGMVKDLLVEVADRELGAAEQRYAELIAHPELIEQRLRAGEAIVETVAQGQLERVREALGL